MKPSSEFLSQPRNFWAHIRTIGQAVGYTERGMGQVKVPSAREIEDAYRGMGLLTDWITDPKHSNHELLTAVLAYLSYRAKTLNTTVEPLLMDAPAAKRLYQEILKRVSPKTPIPMNKQKGKKKQPAYFTGIVNMIVEENAGPGSFDPDPRILTSVVRNGLPIRTLSRRIDGAFPSPINPIAVWEIKEYYYTTTFGSRVADGVYETLLDGMELEDLYKTERTKILHYLFLDSHFTWWECGRSYLCRIIDMLHMGYVDEVIFGREIVTALPGAVRLWKSRLPR